MATNQPVTPDTPITIKISVGENIKKLKLPLKDLTPQVLPAKLTQILGLPSNQTITYERFSDSAGSYITLTPANPGVYKSLVRAAKAKLKLRLRALVPGDIVATSMASVNKLPSNTAMPRETTADILARSGIPVIPVKNSSTPDRKDVGAGIFEFKNARGPPGIPDTAHINQLRQMVQQQRTLQYNQLQQQKVIAAAKAALPANQSEAKLPRIHHDLAQIHVPEAPVPEPFDVANADAAFASLAEMRKALQEIKIKQPEFQGSISSENYNTPSPTWSVYCNECDSVVTNEHFHCSVCDGGDYDLCQHCVDGGKLCPGEGHWLVKRYVKNGQVISSTTERLPPKPKKASASSRNPEKIIPAPVRGANLAAPIFPAVPTLINHPMPGAFNNDEVVKASTPEFLEESRTCNSCVTVFNEDRCVTCTVCDDFDLCNLCHLENKHGHHPGHAFAPVVKSQTMSTKQESLMAAGRNVTHFAVCDGCDKTVTGIRHKCFNCPDFDYCNDCHKSASLTHPGHRFAALYEPIEMVTEPIVRHTGIYCDGPACTSNAHQTYVTGVRYKCVVCHDTDFCANCEALPNNGHNKTHPLIKIKTPVRGLNVSTVNEHANGAAVSGLGDRTSLTPLPSAVKGAIAKAASSSSALAATTIPSSSASSVRTVAHIEPVAAEKEFQTLFERSPHVATVQAKDLKSSTIEAGIISEPAQDEIALHAKFVCDTIPDGISVRADTRFTQIWTLRNPGPSAWPAGCSVHCMGGDNMLNVDRERPFSVVTLNAAKESNVVGREVKAGEEVAFKVILKAPFTPGRKVSYWRLKTATGRAFGDRLWCDINVHIPVDPPVVSGASGDLIQDMPYKRADRIAEITSAMDFDSEDEEDEADEEGSRTAAFYARMARIKHKASATPSNATRAASHSQMVYPTLDKESPASSQYHSSASLGEIKPKAATVEDEATGIVRSAQKTNDASTQVEEPENEIFEDISSEIEVLSASSQMSDDDDGFLTDEEYDILDASDQETVASLK